MALHFDFSNCKGSERNPLRLKAVELPMGGYRHPRPDDAPEDVVEIVHPRLDTMIWATLAVDLPGIEPGKEFEFYSRLRAYEAVGGPMFKDNPFTYQDVLDYSGLKTNVTKTTKAQWAKKLADVAEAEARKDARAHGWEG